MKHGASNIAYKITKYLRHPVRSVMCKVCPRLVSDEAFLKSAFEDALDYPLNLKNPRTFSEKLQYMKLYDRNPLYNVFADKYAVRDYVKDKIGGEHLVPLLGKWNTPDDVKLDTLPDKFVLKLNNDSGGVWICTDKNSFDIEAVRQKMRSRFSDSYYWGSREWCYKDIKPLIFAEEYLDDIDTGDLSCPLAPPLRVLSSKTRGRAATPPDLPDYKFFCFDGVPKFLYIATGRHSPEGVRMTWLDTQWNKLPFQYPHHPACDVPPPKPDNLSEMVLIASRLSEKVRFVRVDLYSVKGKVYFGELTLYPAGGFSPIIPLEWNYKIGDMLHLDGLQKE